MRKEFMIKVLFFGDFLLTETVRQRALIEPGWNPFRDSALADLVRDHDLVVGSLDCSMGENTNPIAGERIILKTGRAAIHTLVHLKMSVMTLATNHSFDFGVAGYEQTLHELKRLEIETVGAGLSLKEASVPLIMERHGLKIALVAAATSDTSAVSAADGVPGVHPFDLEALVAQIRLLRQSCDIIIFLPHWGTEWYALPAPWQRFAARSLIEAGADAIIGNHPHVIQVCENILGKPVFYSLGNAVVTDIVLPGGIVIKQVSKNFKSLAVSLEFVQTHPFPTTNSWILQYDQNKGLVNKGKDKSHFLQKVTKSLFFNEKKYSCFWNIYCAFMEFFYIPIKYKIMNYGLRYTLERINLEIFFRRFSQYFSRVLHNR